MSARSAPGATVTLICAQIDLNNIGDASKTPDSSLFIDWRPDTVQYADGVTLAYDENAVTNTNLWNHYDIEGDIAPEAVAEASRTYQAPNLQYLPASCAALPFADGSFDLVVAFEVIEHIAEWETLIHEARRVLAPGGRLVLFEVHSSSPR